MNLIYRKDESSKQLDLQNSTIDLKNEFPITFRRALKKSFWRGVCFLLVLSFTLLFGESLLSGIQNQAKRDAAELFLFFVNFCFFMWWLGRFVQFHIEKMTYEYKVSGGNLYLSKGLITKEKGSFPLDRITDIYLHRGVGDFFWGLSSLHISTPTVSSGHFAYIHGLTIRSAESLRERLEQLVKASDRRLDEVALNVQNIMQYQKARPKKAAAVEEATPLIVTHGDND